MPGTPLGGFVVDQTFDRGPQRWIVVHIYVVIVSEDPDPFLATGPAVKPHRRDGYLRRHRGMTENISKILLQKVRGAAAQHGRRPVRVAATAARVLSHDTRGRGHQLPGIIEDEPRWTSFRGVNRNK